MKCLLQPMTRLGDGGESICPRSSRLCLQMNPRQDLRPLTVTLFTGVVIGVSLSAQPGAVPAAQKAALHPARPTAHCSQGPWFPRTRPVPLRAGGLPQASQIPWLASGGSSQESRGGQCPAVPPGACPLAQVPLLAPGSLALLNSGPPQLSVEPALPTSSCVWPQPSCEGDFDLPSILCWPVTLDPVGHRHGARLWSQTAVVHGPSPTLTPAGHTHAQFPHL